MLCACSKELYLLHMFVKNFELDIIKRRWFLGLCPLVNIIIRPPPSKFLYPPLVYNGYMRAGGPAAYCGNIGQGVQLLIVGTLGHVQEVLLLTVST